MGLRAGLGGCRKSRFIKVSIPGPSSQQPIAVPTELFWPIQYKDKKITFMMGLINGSFNKILIGLRICKDEMDAAR